MMASEMITTYSFNWICSLIRNDPDYFLSEEVFRRVRAQAVSTRIRAAYWPRITNELFKQDLGAYKRMCSAPGT